MKLIITPCCFQWTKCFKTQSAASNPAIKTVFSSFLLRSWCMNWIYVSWGIFTVCLNMKNTWIYIHNRSYVKTICTRKVTKYVYRSIRLFWNSLVMLIFVKGKITLFTLLDVFRITHACVDVCMNDFIILNVVIGIKESQKWKWNNSAF